MDVEFTLTDNATAYAEALIPRLSRVVSKAVFDVEAHAKAAIQTGNKSGHVYKIRSKTGFRAAKGRFRKRGTLITHQASAPGEAPANLSGGLAGSIQGTMDTPGGLSGTVNVGKAYGEILENTRDRPFMAPAAEAVKPSFEAAIAKALERSL